MNEQHPNGLFRGVQEPARRKKIIIVTIVSCHQSSHALSRVVRRGEETHQILQGLRSCLGSLKRFTVEDTACLVISGGLHGGHSALIKQNHQPAFSPSLHFKWSFVTARLFYTSMWSDFAGLPFSPLLNGYGIRWLLIILMVAHPIIIMTRNEKQKCNQLHLNMLNWTNRLI